MSMPGTEVVNAVIESATIRSDREFILLSHVFVNYETGTQGFGGYVLGGAKGWKAGEHADSPNLAAEWIVSILMAAGVEDWAQLPGCAVRIHREVGWSGKILGIGHIIKSDRWFFPSERFAAMQRNETYEHAD